MDTRQRGFWIAFGCAVLFHAALLVEINRGGAARYAGTAEGSHDAIAVELVTEADLKSRETVALPPPGGGPPPMKPSVQPQPEPTPPPEQAETPPEKAPEPVPPAPEPPQPEKQAAVTPPPEPTPPAPETKSAAPAFEPLVPDLADLPPPDTKTEVKPTEEKKPEPAEKHEAQPAEKPVEKQTPPETAQKQAKPQPPAKKKQQQAKLDLTPPSAMPSVSAIGPGRAAGASRPPGITRSGENDDFGRGVIRALRATMPPPNGVYGRVTVRLLLNNNGDLIEAQVLEPSGKPGLDQSVVFSTKQAYFPLPPAGATVPDRTFFITYVYR